jgi:DNA polymerase III subunit epsilon
MRQIFLDTETTGLDASSGDRLIELGCLEMQQRRLSGQQFHRYLNPAGRASHPDALKVHGITDEFLADKPSFEAVVDEFLAFVAGAELIIHNAPFDVGFIDAELQRVGRAPLREHAGRITDSLVLAREIFPGKANSLDALCKRLEVDLSGRSLHGALLDAGLLAEAYIRMTRGQDSLVAEAGVASRAGSGAQSEAPRADFSQLALPAVALSDEERAAHAQLLAGLKKPVWAVA